MQKPGHLVTCDPQMQTQPKLKINFVNTKICRVKISFPCLETLHIRSHFFSSIPVFQLISQLAVLCSWAFPTQYTYKSCNRTPEVPPPFFPVSRGLGFIYTESTKFSFKTITFSPIYFYQWLSFETEQSCQESCFRERAVQKVTAHISEV